MEKQRLHKILAARGAASRRASEELIIGGHVSVDGRTVRELGTSVSPEADIRVDGRPLREPRKVYYILNKPRGHITSMSDDRGRNDIQKLVGRLRTRVYPVGRLDAQTEGLLLLTNDGELTNILTHPRFKVEKTYLVTVGGRIEQAAVDRLRSGVYLKEGKVSARVRLIKAGRDTSRLEMTISQGYNRQVRRMCAAAGHQVRRLERVKFGPLRLRGVPRGAFRALKDSEVAALLKIVKGAEAEKAPPEKTHPRRKRGSRKRN